MSKGALILGMIIFFCLVFTSSISYPASANSNLTVDWTNGTSIPRSIFEISATASYENKLYLVGGFLEHRIPTAQLFIYYSQTNTWKEGKPMPTARAGLGSQFVDGVLYAVGGSSGDNEGALGTNEAYDPESNSWTKKAPMPTARHHISTALVDGNIFVIGGRETEVPTNLNVNQKYNPKSNNWTNLAPMPTKRSGAAATSIDGYIYVLGGEKIVGSFNNVEKYDPKTDSWKEEHHMPTARLGLDAVSLDGKIYAIGGKTNQTKESATNVNEIFVPN
jgi:N-acetylneuraminic acid mutarotase